jgi:hypothetical protein
MRVFLLRTVFALGFACVLPGVAAAAPIVHEFDATADGTVQNFGGLFDFDSDVALVKFVLGEGVFDFTASTTSFAGGGFDPVLSLYYALAPGDPLTQYTYIGADGGEYPAIFDDSDAGYDSALALTLSRAGIYVLALTQTGNFAYENFAFNWDDDAFQCALGAEGVCAQSPDSGLRAFAGTLQVTDTNTVPEPGTLSLIALGSLATAALRRRRLVGATTRQ